MESQTQPHPKAIVFGNLFPICFCKAQSLAVSKLNEACSKPFRFITDLVLFFHPKLEFERMKKL